MKKKNIMWISILFLLLAFVACEQPEEILAESEKGLAVLRIECWRTEDIIVKVDGKDIGRTLYGPIGGPYQAHEIAVEVGEHTIYCERSSGGQSREETIEVPIQGITYYITGSPPFI